MEEEKWLPVVGFEGLYEVSDLGRVGRLGTTARGRSGKLRVLPGKMMGQHCNHAGYSWITLSMPPDSGLRKKAKKVVHRLVAEAFLGGPPTPNSQVNHIDGVKRNNSVKNLEWVTPAENSAHAVRTGLKKPPNPWLGQSRSPLTPGDVRCIRELYGSGFTQAALSRKFRIANSCVSEIVRGITWKEPII